MGNLAVKHRVSALCSVGRCIGGRGANVGSLLGMSGGTTGNVSAQALFGSSSRLLIWLGQGHSLCSNLMPRNVPRVRLGGVRATRLRASGTDDSQLL